MVKLINMIVKETHPGYCFSRKYLDLSDSEKERVKEICEELRTIFDADSVGFISPEEKSLLVPKCDYVIKIYNGVNIGYKLDGGL